MRLGIIGTGMIVQDLLQGRQDLPVETIWLCATKRSVDAAKELCRTYDLQGYVLAYEELLSKDIDTVYVALPNHLHFSYAKMALESGKDVIVEKPAVTCSREWNNLVDLAKQKQRIILEAMNIHFLPAFDRLKESLPQIGRVKIVSFNFSQYSSRYDAFLRGEILPAFDHTKGGGALMDINVYNLHAMAALFGKPKHISYHGNVSYGIDTSGIVMMDYEELKAVCIGAKDCGTPIMSTIQGEEGTICIQTPISQLQEFRYWQKDKTEKVITEEMKYHRLVYEFLEFERIFRERDEQKAQLLQEITQTVMEMMDELFQGLLDD